MNKRYRHALIALTLVAAAIVAPQLTATRAGAATADAPWPTGPAWQNYVEAPAGAAICPTAVVSTSGTVSGAANLVCGGSGTASLTLASGGATPTIVLDYGKEVGGVPSFTVTAETGSPTLRAGYSESRRYLTATGDGGTPWAEGDPSRSDSYTVTGTGTITNRFVQGGERYEELTLTSPGSVTLSAVGLTYLADRTQAAGYQGYFVSSSDQLNRIWYDGAYTAQLDAVPNRSLPTGWAVAGTVLDAYGTADNGGAGVLAQGTAWADYTDTFSTAVVTNQTGWMVRAQDRKDGYLFILNADNDTAGTPNTLQEFDVQSGNYVSLGSVALSTDLAPGSWHTVSTTVAGSSLSVSLDGTRIATVSSTSHPTGTAGFREDNGERAQFRNLTVVSSAGSTLYANALSSSSALADFIGPGSNTVPSMLDGAKRDRAIWVGDMNVEGPTTYYSTNQTAYIKGSLQLLGSYQLTSGFVTGALPPQDSGHTGAPVVGTTTTYSASYSMYFVLALAGYYLYTGDSAFLTQEWPIVQKELAWNATQLDGNGLFVTTSADGADWDFYDSNKTGEVTAYNVLYYKALLDGARLATAVGQSSLAAGYTSQAAALRTAINAHLFNSASGTYQISNTQTTGVAQDANALAVLYGVAPAANAASILAALKSSLWKSAYGPLPFSSDTGFSSVISPYIGGYELDARLASNDTLDAESLLTTEWGHMIGAGTDNTGTMWENVSSTDGTPGLGTGTSLAHGWSTAPTSALSAYVLGVQPATAGYATWTVQPHPGDLAWTEGQVPTPHGAIAVSWAGTGGVGQFTMSVTAPGGTSGTIAVPTYGVASPIVAVNGTVVWSGGAFTPTAGITGGSADANYVYLTGVAPGTYTVAANPGTVGVPTGYTKCAAENGTCAFTGTASVAFGANGIYTYKTLSGGTACTNTALGDPDFGFAKSCYTGPVTTGPSGSTFCAPENGLCTFTGTKTVAYGAGTAFTQKSLTNGSACSNAVFVDPAFGTVKSCFILP